MPNWKKVIVSGSNATLNDVTLSGTLNIPGFSNLSSSLASLSSTSITNADLVYTSSGVANSLQPTHITNVDGSLKIISTGSRSVVLNASKNLPNIISGSYGQYAAEVIVNGISNVIRQTGNEGSTVLNTSVAILNGYSNIISSSVNSSILAGSLNKIHNGRHSLIGGGNNNCLIGDFYGSACVLAGNSIVGGQHNGISGSSNPGNTNWWNTIGGGEYNKVYNSGCSIIGAGHNNRILGNNASFDNNNRKYQENSIVGGRCNDIIDEKNSHIVGGASNKITGDSTQNTTTQGSNNIIGAGHCNVITGSCCSAILGGKDNCLSGNVSAIIGGRNNHILSTNSSYSFIGAGAYNSITDNSCFSTITNGHFNSIEKSNCYSTIGGGQCNLIQSSSIMSTVGGGVCNEIKSSYKTTIIGGCNNKVYNGANNSAILGGINNCINGPECVHIVGSGNTVTGAGGDAGTVIVGNGITAVASSANKFTYVNNLCVYGNTGAGGTIEGSSITATTGIFGTGTTTIDDNISSTGDFELTGSIYAKTDITASGNVSSSATSTASFGTYLGDGSQLTNLNTTTPTLQQVTTAGNSTDQGLIVSGSTIFKPLTSSPASIEFSTEAYSGARNPTITLKNSAGQKTVHIGHSINDGLLELYNSTGTRVVSIQEHFQAFSPPGGLSSGYGTYFGVTSSISPSVASPDSYVKIAHDGYSAVPYSILQLNKKGTFAGSGSITLQGIMNSNGNSAPSVGITSVNGNRVVNFGGPGFVNANNVHNNYLKYGLQVGGDFTGNSSNMALTDGSLIMSGSTGGFSVKSVSSEAEIKTNDGDTTLTLGTTSSFSYVSASAFKGDGSQLTNLPAASAGSTAGRVVFTTTGGALTTDSGFDYNSADDRLTVSNLTTTTFTASFITSSTIETSGSNIFGDEAGVDVQTLVGTTKMTGSAEVTGSLSLTGVTNALNFTNTNSTASVNTKLSFRHAAGNGYNSLVYFGSNYFRLNNSEYPNAAALYVNGRIQGSNFHAPMNGDGFNIASYNSRFTNNYLNLYGSSGVYFGASNAGFATIRDGAAGTPSATYDIDALLGIVSAGNSTGFGFKVHNSDDHETFAVQDNKKVIVSGSLEVSGSVRVKGQVTGSLTIENSGSTVFEVIGSEGTLFSVDDDLDGTIFSANDKSGLPVLEASASGEVYIGKSPQSLYTTAVISSTTAATTQSIFGLSTSSYGGAFFDYTVQSGSDARAGSIMSVWNGSNISFTETTTTDIGDTTDFNVIVHISQSQAQIASHATRAGYNIKTIIRSI